LETVSNSRISQRSRDINIVWTFDTTEHS